MGALMDTSLCDTQVDGPPNGGGHPKFGYPQKVGTRKNNPHIDKKHILGMEFFTVEILSGHQESILSILKSRQLNPYKK